VEATPKATEMDYIDELTTTVHATAARLRRVPDADAARPPAPGKWSAKQVIGHLIDSVSHNHLRFVRARWQDDLVFVPYDQDAWVSAQAYESATWPELVDLWVSYNAHLARVMRLVPDDVRLRPHTRHNLDDLAWKAVPRDQVATLDYFMRDYVGHLQHHVQQLEALHLPEVTRRPRTLADVFGAFGFLVAIIAIVVGLVQIARWVKHLFF
jgi:hypothetical protein